MSNIVSNLFNPNYSYNIKITVYNSNACCWGYRGGTARLRMFAEARTDGNEEEVRLARGPLAHQPEPNPERVCEPQRPPNSCPVDVNARVNIYYVFFSCIVLT